MGRKKGRWQAIGTLVYQEIALTIETRYIGDSGPCYCVSNEINLFQHTTMTFPRPPTALLHHRTSAENPLISPRSKQNDRSIIQHHRKLQLRAFTPPSKPFWLPSMNVQNIMSNPKAKLTENFPSLLESICGEMVQHKPLLQKIQ